MRRRLAALALCGLLACGAGGAAASAPAASVETFEEGGIRYEVRSGIAHIVHVDESLRTLTVPPTAGGYPTLAIVPLDTPVQADTLIFAPGVTSCMSYHALLDGPVTRIEFPDGFLFTEETDKTWHDWLRLAPYVTAIRLPSTLTPGEWDGLITQVRSEYEDSRYYLAEWYYYYYDEWMLYPEDQPHYDGLEERYRQLVSVEIDPAHPALYDIDGVVFARETDTLLF